MAYLKAHYPAEFMSTLLKPGLLGWFDHEGYHSYLAECEGLGIDVVDLECGGVGYMLKYGAIV